MKVKNHDKCLFVPGSAVSNAVILEFDSSTVLIAAEN